MMYNIGLNIGPNILLFITHNIYINLWLRILQLFLMNFVFNASLKIQKINS
jgi:hypothetical protein